MKYTQRIFWPQFCSAEKLARLFAFLGKHRSLCDEISFFTEGDGYDWRYLPENEIIRRAQFLKKAVNMARDHGFIPVINILNTVGHSDEGGPNAPVPPWQTMVGHDGKAARVCSCPANSLFLEYVVFKYAAFASSKADRYWIDDDVRMNNHSPVVLGCFCGECLADFSNISGAPADRDELVESLLNDKSVREAWTKRNGDIYLNLLMACAEGVRQGHPGSEIGLMTCDASDLIDVKVDFERWFGEMTRITGGRAWLRPGGGFWDDSQPRSLLGKVHSVANTLSRLPLTVRAAYEVENYPFNLGAKSSAITGLESLVAIATTRLDGIMFDILDSAGNNLDSYNRWVEDLGQWVPLWDKASSSVAGTLPLGWCPVYSPHNFEQQSESGQLPAMRSIRYKSPCALQLAGVPLTGFNEGALGYLLNGQAARGMSRDELASLLLKPAIMDAEAALCYMSHGMGDLIGLADISRYTEGVYEIFSDHAINGAHANYIRAVTIKYFGLHSFALRPGKDASSLSTLRDFEDNYLGSALILFQPDRRPPVAVISHMPWDHLLSHQRMSQLRALSRHMLGSEVPIHFECDRAIASWYRVGRDARAIACFLNPGFDPVTLRVQGVSLPELAVSTPQVELGDGGRLFLPPWAFAIATVQ